MSTYAVRVVPRQGGYLGWLCDGEHADVLLFDNADAAYEAATLPFPTKVPMLVNAHGKVDRGHALEVKEVK